jgi:hypothetical protein
VVALGVTILRVGALAIVVGQGCASPSRSPVVALTPPDLVIPPLDAGASSHDPGVGIDAIAKTPHAVLGNFSLRRHVTAEPVTSGPGSRSDR